MKGAIQKLFQQFGDAYIREHRGQLTEQHLKTIRAIQTCGTPAAGWIVFNCADCSSPQYVERSCGSRMCPSCQSGKTRQWLDRQLQLQLPTHYFLITFTVPEELNPFFLCKPKEGFSALFKAASGALKSLAKNPRFAGVDLPGFFGVLHTWGRTLNFHPHIHFVVPGGGIDKAKGIWRSTRKDFYAPGQALGKVFRGLFREFVARAGVEDCLKPSVYRKKWVVDCEAVGQNREGIIKYLAPYVFKTAITDSRIVAINHGSVTFTYVKSGSRRQRRMTLAAREFIRRYLMHVLPSGFMRIRHYGFMGSGCSLPHDRLVALVRMAQAFEVEPIDCVPTPERPLRCPRCGGRLIACRVLDPCRRLVADFRHCRPKRE